MQDRDADLAVYIVKLGIHGRLELVEDRAGGVGLGEHTIRAIPGLGAACGQRHRLITEVRRRDKTGEIDARGGDALADGEAPFVGGRVLDPPSQQIPEQLDRRVAAPRVVPYPGCLVCGAVGAGPARDCAVQARVIGRRALADDRDAGRNRLREGAFRLLAVAGQLEAEIDIRQAGVAPGGAHARAEVDRVRRRAFEDRGNSEVAREVAGHATGGRPSLLVVEPYLFDRASLVARRDDEAVQVLLVVGELLVADVGGHGGAADNELSRGARVHADGQAIGGFC